MFMLADFANMTRLHPFFNSFLQFRPIEGIGDLGVFYPRMSSHIGLMHVLN